MRTSSMIGIGNRSTVSIRGSISDSSTTGSLRGGRIRSIRRTRRSITGSSPRSTTGPCKVTLPATTPTLTPKVTIGDSMGTLTNVTTQGLVPVPNLNSHFSHFKGTGNVMVKNNIQQNGTSRHFRYIGPVLEPRTFNHPKWGKNLKKGFQIILKRVVMNLNRSITLSIVQNSTVHTPDITNLPTTKIMLNPSRLKGHLTHPTGDNLNSRNDMFIVKLVIKSLGNSFTFHGPKIPKVEHNSSGTHNEHKKERKRKREPVGQSRQARKNLSPDWPGTKRGGRPPKSK